MRRLEGRVALVTGAGSGIGRGIAERYSQEGAHVVLVGRTQTSLDETAALLDGRSTVIVADVSRDEDNARIASRVTSDIKQLDILVHNAAQYFRRAALDLTSSDLRKMYDTNVVGVVELSRLLHPLLRQSQPSGCVITISSTAALGPSANSIAYGSTKQALIYATGCMAAEWGPEVRVNCIAPGFVDTPIHRHRGLSEADVRAFLDELGTQHPMQRVGDPEDIAGAAAYLASDDARWVTGTTLVVDGGYSVGGS